MSTDMQLDVQAIFIIVITLDAVQQDQTSTARPSGQLPPSVEVKYIGLVLDIELSGRRRDAASMQDPSVLHHSRAGVDPIGR